MGQQANDFNTNSSSDRSENDRKTADAKMLSAMFFETHVKDKESKGGLIRTITLACKPDSEKVEMTLDEFQKMMKFLAGGRH